MATKEFISYSYVLGVSLTASPEHIVQAYRKKSRDIPRSGNRSIDGYEQIKLDDAYHILTHRYKKTVYDKIHSERLQGNEQEKIADAFERAITKVEAWKASLEGGDEDSEADYGRMAGLRSDEIDESSLWAPSLTSGEVALFDGWLG